MACGGWAAKKVGQDDCDVVELSFMKNQRSWRLWLAKTDHLPRKLMQVVRVSYDIVAEESWSEVTVNAEIPNDGLPGQRRTGGKSGASAD